MSDADYRAGKSRNIQIIILLYQHKRDIGMSNVMQ